MNFTRSASARLRVASSLSSETPGLQLNVPSRARARRSLFQHPQRTDPPMSHIGHGSGQTRTFYGTSSRSSTYSRNRSGTWQPGEVLPTCMSTSQDITTLANDLASYDETDVHDDTGDNDGHDGLVDSEHEHEHMQLQQPALWQDIKSLFSNEFFKVNENLSKLSDRIGKIESTVTDLENKVQDLTSDGSLSSSSSAASSSNGPSRKRKRLSPLALQVCPV